MRVESQHAAASASVETDRGRDGEAERIDRAATQGEAAEHTIAHDVVAARRDVRESKVSERELYQDEGIVEARRILSDQGDGGVSRVQTDLGIVADTREAV